MRRQRLTMVRATSPLSAGPMAGRQEAAAYTVRNLNKDDGKLLGALMYAAYLDSVDYEGGTENDTMDEAGRTLGGTYGDVIYDASFFAMHGGEAASVTVVTAYPKRFPLLAFSLTRPEHQNRGLARRLITMSLERLASLGIEQLYLVVSEDNAPALYLYRKLGFEEIPVNS